MSFWKRLFQVGAAVAIPYVAPALGASLNQLTGLDVFRTGAGQIGLGAGLGALGARATGGDWRTGAAIGAGGVAAQRLGLFAPAERAAQQMFGGGGGYGLAPDVPGVTPSGISSAPAFGGVGGASGAVAPEVTATPASVISRIGGTLGDRLSDPNMWADMTLRAAGMMSGSAIAGSGLSPEEEQLLAQQTEELRRLQQTNQQLFQERLQQAQALAGEAKYFDPQYFGLQAARRTQTAMGREAAAGLRGLTGERRAAAQRRAGLDIARATGTAFDTGFGRGMQGQMQARSAAAQALPSSAPSSMADYTALSGAYGAAAKRKQEAEKSVGGLFADVFSPDNEKNRTQPKT